MRRARKGSDLRGCAERGGSFTWRVLQRQVEEKTSQTQVKTERAREYKGARRLEYIAKVSMRPNRNSGAREKPG
jgi:pyridoxine/pyridoxamine 5'-phosphate oxidase